MLQTSAVIIVQARTNSSRLPKKTIKKIKNQPLIYFLLKRLLRTNLKIVLATPLEDEKIFRKILQDFPSIDLFLGSTNNVLERYYQCAQQFPTPSIIRVTADNPFTSVRCLLTLLEQHAHGGYDYSYFRELPLGTGVEIIKKITLNQIYEKTQDKKDQQHVTGYLRKNLKKYHCFFPFAPLEYRYPHLRLTIDTASDFLLAEKIIESYFYDVVPLSYIIKNYHNFF